MTGWFKAEHCIYIKKAYLSILVLFLVKLCKKFLMHVLYAQKDI